MATHFETGEALMAKVATNQISGITIKKVLKSVGHDIHGDAIELASYYLVAELSNGERYRHYMTYQHSVERARVLMKRIAHRGVIDLDYWEKLR
jgi:hypothetical protein